MAVSKQFEQLLLAVIEEFLDQKKEVEKLEKEKSFLLRLIVDIDEVCNNGLLDTQQVAVAIKQLTNQIETGAIHSAKIEPGLVRG